jgi:methyl coenzyme M reductase subunit C
MGVHGVDKSLGSIGFMMQQTLCPTMKICSIIKKIKVALETAEIAPWANY